MQVRAAEADALASAVVTVTGNTICGYVPVGSEPGSVAMLDALVADGRRVLLSGVRAELLEGLARSGILAEVGEENVWPNLEEALACARDHLAD